MFDGFGMHFSPQPSSQIQGQSDTCAHANIYAGVFVQVMHFIPHPSQMRELA